MMATPTATSAMDDLVRRAMTCDPQALGEIAELYAARLYGFVYRLTGCRDDAEELVQEVFARLMRNIGKYQHDGRFEAWLFTIATNVTRDAARRRKNDPIRRDLPSGMQADELAHRNGLAPRPDAGSELADEAARLQVALAALPEPEREVIMLRHYGELEFAEIARLMGTPIGTALARSHRGLAKLRAMME